MTVLADVLRVITIALSALNLAFIAPALTGATDRRMRLRLIGNALVCVGLLASSAQRLGAPFVIGQPFVVAGLLVWTRAIPASPGDLDLLPRLHMSRPRRRRGRRGR